MTLFEFTELFSVQRMKSPICSGDYLEGETFEAKLEKMKAVYNAPAIQEVPARNMEELLQSKIIEWEAHKGEQMVFYALETGIRKTVKGEFRNPARVSIEKCWSSDIPGLYETLEFINMATSNMPRFQRKEELFSRVGKPTLRDEDELQR